jgi:hypothetical protein
MQQQHGATTRHSCGPPSGPHLEPPIPPLSTRSDGSELYIDGKSVVKNGGQHYATKKQGSLTLDEGRHSFVVTYFHKNGKLMEGVRGGATLEVTLQREVSRWAMFSR